MTTTINESTQSAQQLSAQILEKIFGESSQTFDMEAGTVLSNTDVRVIYLSSDIIHAIYDVLKYESGDAWSLILKNCGVIWGKRVNESLEKELQITGSKKIGHLTVDSYIALLEVYFANHGWGKMRFNLDNAESDGVIRATLSNSLFANTLRHLDTPVDFMIAGMLQSIFSGVSGQDLRCTQISYAYSDTDASDFLISGSERISQLEQLKIHELNPNEALEHLRVTR
jgi:predicted hydrocarbon binding protein